MKRLLPFLLILASCSEEPKPKVSGTEPAKPAPPYSVALEIPNHWHAKCRPDSMRYKSFQAGKADVSVVYLTGKVATDLSNINRWRRQLDLQRWTEKELRRDSLNVITQLGNARLVDFTSSTPDRHRLVGAIIRKEEGTWLVKMRGDSKTIEEEREAFLSFLQQLEPEDGYQSTQ